MFWGLVLLVLARLMGVKMAEMNAQAMSELAEVVVLWGQVLLAWALLLMA